MSPDIEHGQYKIDEVSQQILLLLKERGKIETGNLADLVDVEQNQVILYRMREYLRPAGLVSYEAVPYRQHHEKHIHFLTDAGEEFVDEHREEMELPISMHDLAEDLEAIRDDLASLESQVQSIQGKDGRVQKLINEIEDTLGSAKSAERRAKHIEHIVDRAVDARDSARESSQEASSAGNRAEQAALKAENVADAAGKEAVEAHAKIRELEEKFNELETQCRATIEGQNQMVTEHQLAGVKNGLNQQTVANREELEALRERVKYRGFTGWVRRVLERV